MFGDIYDAVSVLWCWRWPETVGEVTDVRVERSVDSDGGETFRLAVYYKFSIGNDGPYTGVSSWQPSFTISSKRVMAARDRVRVHQQVLVRYRSDNPSVNMLDKCVWQNL